MNKLEYKEYLNSSHWRAFRKKIYSNRKRCQRCTGNKNLNIHHVTYKNLGNESEDDVLVLCNTCHFIGHKKKRFIVKMRKGEDLDFVGKTKKPNSEIYNASNVYRSCDRCGKQHPVFYKYYEKVAGGISRLCIACPTSRPRVNFLKFEKNLPIPTL